MITVIKQKVELWTPPLELTSQVYRAALAGRVCYQSEGKTPEKEFLLRIMERGHESVLEHISFTFSVITSRATSHQLVRHRIGVAYSQESQRYCNYNGSLQVIIPEPELSSTQFKIWEKMMKDASENYDRLTDKDNVNHVRAEVARGVLPNDAKTQLVVTYNLRSFRHFCRLRLDKHAQFPIRDLATQMYRCLEREGFGWFFTGIDLTHLTH